LDIPDLAFIPISALLGDGVVQRGAHLGWHRGPTLLEALEAAPLALEDRELPFRFPVQWVCRPRQGPQGDFRGYAGRVASGEIQVGAEITVLPAGLGSRVKAIRLGQASLGAAQRGQSVTLVLEDELDIGRGDLLAGRSGLPAIARQVDATLCWFSETPAAPGSRYRLKAGTRETRATLEGIRSRLDLATLAAEPAGQLAMNDIAEVRLGLQAPIAADRFDANPATGAFILMDERDNATVAAGMIRNLE
jgi:sulfate adenylyltransferase subunit 1